MALPQPAASDLAPVPAQDPEHALPPGFGAGLRGKVLYGIALVFSAFQVFTAAYPILPSQVVRAVHVGFLLLVAFALIGNHSKKSWQVASGWALGAVSFAVGLYQWVFYVDLIQRAGEPNEIDMVVGVLSLALLFLAAWRVMGPALATICGFFLLYSLFGNYLPAPFDHRGYPFEQVIDHMAFGTEGIYGTPILVSSTYIFLFILFGAFLESAGMIKVFSDVALGLVGHTRGGAAKVAVVASGFMGTISGSGVANVVATGQFTIPLMKRFGYRAEFAGGVEATASMGGQIMPPVMGAVAFIMAETLGLPYTEIIKAAIVPALLYYFSAFWAVHLEAGKHNLVGMPRSQCPSAFGAIRDNWHLMLPLAALIYLLITGYTPLYSGTVGLAFTAILIIAGAMMHGLRGTSLRVLVWIAIGAVCAGFLNGRFGIGIIALLIGVLVVITYFAKGGRETLIMCRGALASGARQALPVGIACAIVGIIVGTMTLTGVGTIFGNYVISVGEKSLFLSLVLTMLVCLLLGMGVPTIPNYIITSSLAGPALLKLGIPLLVSHMFVFYFGIMADLTPPVALAAFAAAPIARASGTKIGLEACRIALAGYVVPFMAVYTPALMLQDGGPLAAEYGYWTAVAYIIGKTVLAILLWGAASIGYLRGHLAWWERILAGASALLLVLALPITDEAGFAACGAFFMWHWWRTRLSAAGRVAR
jgi:TRAP transporter 4TM/12TM fusion protein